MPHLFFQFCFSELKFLQQIDQNNLEILKKVLTIR